MAQAFGEMLPFARVVALSPIPIVAVIAMLFSQRVANTIRLALGLLGLAAAIRKWSGPRPGNDVPLPGRMERVDGMHAGRAFGLAVVLGSHQVGAPWGEVLSAADVPPLAGPFALGAGSAR